MSGISRDGHTNTHLLELVARSSSALALKNLITILRTTDSARTRENVYPRRHFCAASLASLLLYFYKK